MRFEDVSRLLIIIDRRHDLEGDLDKIDSSRIDPVAITHPARIDGMDDPGVRK